MISPRPHPLRVLHVTAVERSNYYLNNLAQFLPRERVEILGVTLGRDLSFVEGLAAAGGAAWALDATSRRSYPRALFRLWSLIRAERVDIVHLHLFEPTVVGLLAARISGRPAVLTRHHSDAVHRLPRGAKRRAYAALERWINRRASHIVAPSRRVREVLTGPEGVPPEKVSLIPYGQRADRFEPVRAEDPLSARRELGMGTPALVCVARLHPEKGHGFLFEAFARLKNAHPRATLTLVGTGPDREPLAARARDLGIADAVHFLGWRDDALLVMWAADMVVHPSLHEALPSAVIEGIMLGRPVIATDVSGVRDVLGESGEYGVVVPPGRADELLAAMVDVLGRLDDARLRAERGRQHVTAYMDPARVAREYLARYEAVAARRPP